MINQDGLYAVAAVRHLCRLCGEDPAADADAGRLRAIDTMGRMVRAKLHRS